MINITDDERVQFLKAHNDIRNMAQTIHECGDVWVSDLRKLEDLEHLLHSVMKFVPQMDDEGRPQFYKDFVLAELEDEK